MEPTWHQLRGNSIWFFQLARVPARRSGASGLMQRDPSMLFGLSSRLFLTLSKPFSRCGRLIWPPENGRHEAVSGGSPELPGVVVRRVVAQRRV